MPRQIELNDTEVETLKDVLKGELGALEEEAENIDDHENNERVEVVQGILDKLGE